MIKNTLNHFTLFFILAVCFNYLSAQSQAIDSLKKALKVAKHDTERCNILYNLIIEETSDSIWILYNAEIIRIAEKNLAKDSISKQSKFFYSKIIEAKNNEAFVARQDGDINLSLKIYYDCLRYLKKTNNPSLENFTMNSIAQVYYFQGNVEKAFEFYNKALASAEKIGDKRSITYALIDLGSIYHSLGESDKGIEYYNKALKILKETEDYESIATTLNNIGFIYRSQHKYDKALEIFRESLKIREDLSKNTDIASSYNNIGETFYSLNKMDSSLFYFMKGLELYESSNEKRGISISYNSIAGLYHNKKDLNRALFYAKKGLELSTEIGLPENISLTAGTLKLIYIDQKNYKEAYKMQELEILMRDSVKNEATKKASLKSQLRYEYEKRAAEDSVAHSKESEIKNIQLQKQQLEIKTKKNQQYFLYSGLLIAIVFAGFIFNRFKITQKQKQIIEIKEFETQQQKHLIEEKHKEITDSINYAERIQRSFLATKQLLDENLNEYFVFFKPKDIVSGDFYWAATIQEPQGSNTNKKFVLVTADSTGHGVPGAIMSLLNVTSLEKAVESYIRPADILNSTRKTIIERLKKDGSPEGGKDGMDASLCVYDFKNMKLTIASANNPVWIVRNRTSFSPEEGQEVEAEIIEVKPDKMPIGKHDKQNISFTQQEFDLKIGDVIYTLTDGFPDQFGGPNGKKFMSKKLREMLISIAHLPMQEQKQLVESTFAEWVGNMEQVDDVTLIGVRV